jgi:hypothetical protein
MIRKARAVWRGNGRAGNGDSIRILSLSGAAGRMIEARHTSHSGAISKSGGKRLKRRAADK